MKHRCPWCGENTENNCHGTYIYGMTCNSCNNKFVAYRKTPVYLFFLFIVILFIVIAIVFDLPFMAGGSVITLGMISLVLSKCPYVKETQHYVMQTRQICTFDIYGRKETKMFLPKINLCENQIVTLCFVDKNNLPISKMVAAALESVHIKKNHIRCILAFLPLSNLDKVYPEGTRFYIFYNERKIGKGCVEEEAKGF